MPGLVPDPLSVWWESAARRALQIAYSHPGRWYGSLIANPSERQKNASTGLIYQGGGWPGIGGPDIHPGRKAKTRWARAFTRALERVNKREFGLQIEWNIGPVFTGGRAFRVRTVPPGQLRKPLGKPRQRIFNDDGTPGSRFAHVNLRDWDING